MRRRAKDQRLRTLSQEVASLRAAIGLLHRISHLVVTALELEPTCYAILTGVTAGAGLGLQRAMLFLRSHDGRSLIGAAALGPFDQQEARRVRSTIATTSPDLETLYASGLRRRGDPGRLDQRVRAVTLDAEGDTPVALALRRGEFCVSEGADDAGGLFHLSSAIAAPLGDRRAFSGVLYADNCFTSKRLDPIGQMVFTMVAEDAGRALENAERYERALGLARTDPLTGLGHHGAFVADLAREASAALRDKRALSLAMIDLDGFKRVNDDLGHLAGDALLVGLSGRMRGVVRGGEGVYRFGGDEFVALLPGADRASAVMIGERLCQAISSQPFALGAGQPLAVTCSIGVASLPEDAGDPRSLIAMADEALLRAKASGKNRVEVAKP